MAFFMSLLLLFTTFVAYQVIFSNLTAVIEIWLD